MSILLRLCLSLVLLAPALVHAATLENPRNGSFYSGIGVISVWKCTANGPLTVRFNEGNPIPLAYFNERGDTASVCGDTNNGFVAIVNWAELGDGTHTAVVYDNGAEFARSTFTVATTGESFVTGAVGECRVPDFPAPGETMRFVWNEATQHLEMMGDSDDGGRGGGSGGGGGGDSYKLSCSDENLLCTEYISNSQYLHDTIASVCREAGMIILPADTSCPPGPACKVETSPDIVLTIYQYVLPETVPEVCRELEGEYIPA